jgi:hypothetical protein
MKAGAVLFGASFVLAVLAAFAALFVAVIFAPGLTSFGPELPAIAAVSVTIAPWLVVLPVAALALAFLRGSNRRLATAACALTILLSAVSIAGIILPLSKLAAAM